jgi:hypothetical protein
VAELVHRELQRHTVLEGEADGGGEGAHDAGRPAYDYAHPVGR